MRERDYIIETIVDRDGTQEELIIEYGMITSHPVDPTSDLQQPGVNSRRGHIITGFDATGKPIFGKAYISINQPPQPVPQGFTIDQLIRLFKIYNIPGPGSTPARRAQWHRQAFYRSRSGGRDPLPDCLSPVEEHPGGEGGDQYDYMKLVKFSSIFFDLQLPDQFPITLCVALRMIGDLSCY